MINKHFKNHFPEVSNAIEAHARNISGVVPQQTGVYDHDKLFEQPDQKRKISGGTHHEHWKDASDAISVMIRTNPVTIDKYTDPNEEKWANTLLKHRVKQHLTGQP